MQVDLVIIAGAAGILADQAGRIGLLDRGLEVLRLVIEFTADIDVAGARPHADAGQQAALQQFVRVVTQDVAIFAGARLALIGIDDEVGRPVALLRHERPFEPGRETGAAAAAQPGLFDLVDDPVAAFEDHVASAVPIAPTAGAGKPPIAIVVEVGEYPVAVSQHRRHLRQELRRLALRSTWSFP